MHYAHQWDRLVEISSGRYGRKVELSIIRSDHAKSLPDPVRLSISGLQELQASPSIGALPPIGALSKVGL